MANHQCPGCGLLHQSDGNEVPENLVHNVMHVPHVNSVEELEQLARNTSELFEKEHARLMEILERDKPKPVVISSTCPVCLGKGKELTFTDGDEFHKHMTDEHTVKSFPVPKLQCPLCPPGVDMTPEELAAHLVDVHRQPAA